MVSTRGYKKKYFRKDILAGLLVTAVAVPELLGIAALAGVPLQMGLYSALLAPIVFALFGVSRRLIVGADSATAVLLASGAGVLAAAGSDQYVQIIVFTGLLSALFLALVAVFKLTFLSNLISRPVMVGFLAGIGIQLVLTKFPEMLGLTMAYSKPLDVVAQLPGALGAINWMSVTVSMLVVGIIVILRGSKVPGILVGFVGAGVFAYLFQLSQQGVVMVGALPSGLPSPAFPVLALDTLVAILPVALSVTLVILVQSTSVIRDTADEHDEKTDIQRDMYALSAAGVASALTQGLAINGSPPRTLAADLAGMRSQVASIVMSLLVALVLLFGGGLFQNMPAAALSSIVFMMGYRLIRLRELRYLANHHKIEFGIAMLACVGVVVLGVLYGVIIAVVASLMERLRREYKPSDSVLLRDGVLSEWASERMVGLRKIPDNVLVFSFGASLFFENAEYFTLRLQRAIRKTNNPLAAVIIDASAMDDIDYTAVERLKKIYRQLSVDGIRLGFCHVPPYLVHLFEEYGVIDLIGKENVFATLRSALEYTPSAQGTIVERIDRLKLPKDQFVVAGGAIMGVLNLREVSVIDLVVSNEVYNQFAQKPHWREYPLGTGKMVLTHHGINLMRSWYGRTIGMIKKGGVFELQGVNFMSIDQLIECKQNLGRRKDQSDIALLHSHKVRHHS